MYALVDVCVFRIHALFLSIYYKKYSWDVKITGRFAYNEKSVFNVT